MVVIWTVSGSNLVVIADAACAMLDFLSIWLFLKAEFFEVSNNFILALLWKAGKKEFEVDAVLEDNKAIPSLSH